MKEILGTMYYFVEEIASELGLNEKTIRRYLQRGKLEGVKLGRRWLVSERALLEFFEGLRTGSEGR
ncbi:MAG: helix-turn-helix domain-containing protein [Candidatus Neomarinimicrobiota bacterium]